MANNFMAFDGLTVNQLAALRNAVDARIFSIRDQIKGKNTPILVEEVMNLFDCVGDGFREGDYYAPNRYYSRIKGVKNIRVDKCYPNGYGNPSVPCILVKIESPEGDNLPKEIEIRGRLYPVEIMKSKNYFDEVNY